MRTLLLYPALVLGCTTHAMVRYCKYMYCTGVVAARAWRGAGGLHPDVLVVVLGDERW